MGYFVDGDGTITIKNTDKTKAYQAMIALNQRDDLKHGGSSGGQHGARNPRPRGLDHHPDKWFSWLKADYPSICPDFESVLEHLGFEVQGVDHDDSTTYRLYYSSKTGQEGLFLETISPWITGKIEWSGEDGNRWLQEFASGSVTTKKGRVVYD